MATWRCDWALRCERLKCSGCCRSRPAFEITVSDTLQSLERAPGLALNGRKERTADIADGCGGGGWRMPSGLRQTSSDLDQKTAALRVDGSLPTQTGHPIATFPAAKRSLAVRTEPAARVSSSAALSHRLRGRTARRTTMPVGRSFKLQAM